MGGTRELVVTIKVSPEELEMIKRGAESEGKTQSQYCRACVIRDRLLEGDPTALKIVKENISQYILAKEDSIQQMLEKLIGPWRELRMGIKSIGSGKGGRVK